jgi:23S rRNA (guanine745-N1)-methyltransferase
VLDEVLHLLACPHCGAPLAPVERSVACPNGHSFDVARQGYVSLLPGGARRATADTAAMVAAREAFLGAGHFDRLGDALADECERALAFDGCVVDLGAGTGWYLARVLDRLRDRPGLALDLSAHALRRAARAHPRAGAVACDVWRRLPVRDAVAALALSVFAPRNGAEIARLLRPGGAVVAVTPTSRHLEELVGALGLLSVDERKRERLAASLDPYLELSSRSDREWRMELRRDDVANAAAMGPSAHHVEPGRLERRVAGLPEPVAVTASVTLSVYRRRG